MIARLRALTLIAFAAVVALVASGVWWQASERGSATAGTPSDRG